MTIPTKLITQDEISTLQPVAQPFTDEQIKNLNYLTKVKNVDVEEAIGLVRSPEKWDLYITEARRGTILRNIDLIEKVQKKIAEKIEAGFTGAAKEGGVLLAILQDNSFGQPSERNGPMFNVNGKNVGIKVNFDFKPQKK